MKKHILTMVLGAGLLAFGLVSFTPTKVEASATTWEDDGQWCPCRGGVCVWIGDPDEK